MTHTSCCESIPVTRNSSILIGSVANFTKLFWLAPNLTWKNSTEEHRANTFRMKSISFPAPLSIWAAFTSNSCKRNAYSDMMHLKKLTQQTSESWNGKPDLWGTMGLFCIPKYFLYAMEKVMTIVNGAVPLQLQSQSLMIGWGVRSLRFSRTKIFHRGVIWIFLNKKLLIKMSGNE